MSSVSSVELKLQKLRSDLLRVAADAVLGAGLPSDWDEDHPPKQRRGYWLKQLEQAHEAHRRLALRLKKIVDETAPL